MKINNINNKYIRNEKIIIIIQLFNNLYIIYFFERYKDLIMKGSGKKKFPEKYISNIFFFDNRNKTNINPNIYVNKNVIKNERNNRYISNENTKHKNTILESRRRNKSLEIFNTISLDDDNNSTFLNDNQINRRKVLYSQKSVDFLRPKRILGDFSTRNYILNKNNIWEKNHTKENENDNLFISSREYRPLNTISSFSNGITKNMILKNNKKRASNNINFYNKFVNKAKPNQDNQKATKIHFKKTRNRNIFVPPREQVFIIKKENPDNKLIDINEIKKKFSENGVNLISISGASNSLIPVNNDAVKIKINLNDVNSNKLNKIEKLMKKKGLKINGVKKDYHIKYTRGIYPNKSDWKDVTYGGREKFEKFEISSKFQKDHKENKFRKKDIMSKLNFYHNYRYKNNFHISPKRYKSVENERKND